MRVFILANGKATRWNNYLNTDKQLIVIDNETLINRMVRLLKENGQNDIYIIGKYEVDGCKNYIPNFESIIGKYDITRELWDCDEFVLLYGDCYYTEAIIKDICERKPNKWLHWACNRPNKVTGKIWEEGYAHKVSYVKWWEEKCKQIHNLIDDNKIEYKNDWVFLRFLLDIDLYMHQPELMKDYEVDWEDETDDFDFPIDYDNWMKNVKGIKVNKRRYVSLLASNEYLPGTLVLNKSLKDVNSKYDLLVMTGKNVSDKSKQILTKQGIEYKDIPDIELGITCLYKNWTDSLIGINYFNLTQFDKIVTLGADMVVFENIDELFEEPHMSSVTAGCSKFPGWIGMNAELIVIEPSNEEYNNIIETYRNVEDKTLNIQDHLSHLYPNFKRLNEMYNVLYCFSKEYIENKWIEKVKVMHFINQTKPWMNGFVKENDKYINKFFEYLTKVKGEIE